MYFIGLISGTSMDAIDCALVRFDKDQLKDIEYTQYPIPDKLHNSLKSVTNQTSLESITRMDVTLGKLFADACLQVINNKNLQPADITAVGSHGQTVLHRPDGDEPTTMQIGDPNIIAYKTGITTVADFRRMDMAAGGQGAPLVPAFHEYFFRSSKENRVILNIGGIANITLLPQDTKIPVTGFDTGPGNVLMDDWANQNINKPMDIDGRWARQGEIQHELLNLFLGDEYFSAPPPKSTGRDYFNIDWLLKYISSQKRNLKSEDIQATLVLLTARSITDCIKKYATNTQSVVVCGGGTHNACLMETIKNCLNDVEVNTTSDYGLDPDSVEAVTFAWLAKQRLEKKPGNIRSVTGAADSTVLGCIYN